MQPALGSFSSLAAVAEMAGSTTWQLRDMRRCAYTANEGSKLRHSLLICKVSYPNEHAEMPKAQSSLSVKQKKGKNQQKNLTL